jgi:hypothetical protein
MPIKAWIDNRFHYRCRVPRPNRLCSGGGVQAAGCSGLFDQASPPLAAPEPLPDRPARGKLPGHSAMGQGPLPCLALQPRSGSAASRMRPIRSLATSRPDLHCAPQEALRKCPSEHRRSRSTGCPGSHGLHMRPFSACSGLYEGAYEIRMNHHAPPQPHMRRSESSAATRAGPGASTAHTLRSAHNSATRR